MQRKTSYASVSGAVACFGVKNVWERKIARCVSSYFERILTSL